MPRRNSNAVHSVRKPRKTHVLVDTLNGYRIVTSGTKAAMQAEADELNAAQFMWRYRVKPIHK